MQGQSWCPADHTIVDWAATCTGAAPASTPQQLGYWLPDPPSPPCPLAPSSDAPVRPLPKLCIVDGPAPSFMRLSLFARLPTPMAEPETAAVRARVWWGIALGRCASRLDCSCLPCSRQQHSMPHCHKWAPCCAVTGGCCLLLMPDDQALYGQAQGAELQMMPQHLKCAYWHASGRVQQRLRP